MMVLRCGPQVAVIGAVAVLLTLAGCGHRAEPPAPKAASATKAAVPLPDWAPRNPSPEFLRAAKVLKPLPEEMLLEFAGKNGGGPALLERFRRTMPASYELLGALDDRQIEHLRATHEVRIPVKSLTAKQREALDRWFDTWRVALKGAGPGLEEWLPAIYKLGGKEDLSNVDVGFTAVKLEGGRIVAGHIVQVYFWVRQPGGKVGEIGSSFAQF
jgi:hypothetical protein